MFKNVVVGLDEHEGGRDATALARILGAEDGELTFAYVYPGDPQVWHGSSAAYDAAERERAQELLEKAREEAGVEAKLRWRGSPSVGRGLHELAEAIGADLLVIGSSRRGLLGRVLVGDDTRAALNGAPCAVAIAPTGYAQTTGVLHEIGVGYNRSAESEHALTVARALAGERSGKLSAFQAVSLPAYLFMGVPAPVDLSIEDTVKEAREGIAALGDIEAHAAYGCPSEELAVYSASLDLLVLGSRDYGPIGRLVHGSTTHQLARTARCPLLVLTRAARAAEPPAALEDSENAVIAARA